MDIQSQEQKKLGLRIKSARVLTGLNQEEFARECGFNHTSLRNWEFGRVYPRGEAIKKLIKAFEGLGVFTGIEWLLRGAGEGPMFSGNASEPKNEFSNKPLIAVFKETIENVSAKPIIVTIANDEMKPFFYAGDIVGGIVTAVHEIERWPMPKKIKLLSEPVLSKCDDEDFQPHWLNFDKQKWWVRSQNNFALKPLASSVVGIISMRIHAWKGPSME